MTGITFRQQFEAVFLEGKDPNSIFAKDSIVTGADGEYFHPHTRMAFKFYSRGYSDGAADVAVDEVAPEAEATATATSLSADPWCTACAGKGNQHGDLCPSCWTEIPF